MTKLRLNILSILMMAALVLGLMPQPAFAYSNTISNPSVEASLSGTYPTDWQSSSWGSLNAVFSYSSSGQSGSHSVRVDVSGYQSGDAKWFFKPVAVVGQSRYVFSDYYKSSTASSLVAAYSMLDGSTQYSWVTDLPASSKWASASAYLTTPSGAVSATVYHLISSNGWLQTDSFGFKQAEDIAVSAGITNNSFEIQDELNSNYPAAWQTAQWGLNTSSFSYVKNSGYSSARSAKIVVTNYQSGDAKWVFNPVAVSPGQNYAFSDYYKSTQSTNIVAQFTSTTGVVSYRWLGTVPAASNWSRASYYVAAPSDAATVSVMHVLSANGTLQTDTYSLLPAAAVSLTNGVPNNSMEQVSDLDPGQPLAWRAASWGTNKPSFSYLNTGHTGTRSVKVALSSYTDGDAKWIYDDQPISPGSIYQISAWYQSSVTAHAIAMFNTSSGSVSYMRLRNADTSSTQWSPYTDSFVAPDNAAKVSVFFYIDSVGYFTSDDYSVVPHDYIGFDKPRLSLTFDDGPIENITNVLPGLNQYGFKATHYYIGDSLSDQATLAGMRSLYNAGQEIGSHTMTHADLTSISLSQVISELTNSQIKLKSSLSGAAISSFASPYGLYNATTVGQIAKLYRSQRTVDVGYNSKDNFDVYRLKVQNMYLTTSPMEVSSWISRAQRDNTWLILVFHKVADVSPESYDTTTADFSRDLGVIAGSGISVLTINQALNELTPQL